MSNMAPKKLSKIAWIVTIFAILVAVILPMISVCCDESVSILAPIVATLAGLLTIIMWLGVMLAMLWGDELIDDYDEYDEY